MIIENRYPVNKEIYMDWIKHPVNRFRALVKYLWMLLLVLILVCSVFAFINADMFIFWVSVVFLLLCVYQAFFRNKALAARQFKLLSVARGEQRWERVVTFSDIITVTDGRSTSEFAYEQITELVDCREYLALGIGKGLSAQYLRLLKDGFGQMSAQEFKDFIKREHAHILIREK